MKEFSYKVERKITEQQLKDFIVDALEGAIGYWACLDNDTPEFKKAYKDKLEEGITSQIAAHFILNGDKIILIDEEEETSYELTLEKLMNGLKLNEEQMDFDGDYDNYDSTTCDCVFQYAVFGEVIYG